MAEEVANALREITVVRSLPTHPNLGDLARELSRRAREAQHVPPTRVRDWARQLLAVLALLHGQETPV
eukprot:gene41-7617_t